MRHRVVVANGAELGAESFGEATDPPLLLIMGAMASMLWWPVGLCRMLAERGRYVIRYDQRDTGCSTTYPPGQPAYSMDDLAADVLGVLDAYGLPKVHLVGMSLGGMVAQLVTLNH